MTLYIHTDSTGNITTTWQGRKKPKFFKQKATPMIEKNDPPPLASRLATSFTPDEWMAEGERRFGPVALDWKFVCPACGHVQSARDYKAAGAPDDAIGFSCVGRWLPPGKAHSAFYDEGPGPCDYAGFGLFRLNPVRIAGTLECGTSGEARLFAFADADYTPPGDAET